MRSAKRQKLAALRRKIASDSSVAATEGSHDDPNDHIYENAHPVPPVRLEANIQDRDALSDGTEPLAEAGDPCRDHGTGIAVTAQMEPNFTANTEEIVSSEIDESESAHPPVAGVENDATDTERKDQMQTAKQLKPLSDSGIAEKVDLRDETPAKPDNAMDKVQPLTPGGLGSLFGPIIEDDVKGVRSQIREMIQGELQGELGQRFSRNLRIVIRREIAAAVDDQFDRV